MMRCAECDCKHGDACCNWIKSDGPCAECVKPLVPDALKRLIEEIEASEEPPQFGLHMGYLKPNTDLAKRAYEGSIDAAKALHDALLPGWVVSIDQMKNGKWDVDMQSLNGSLHSSVMNAPSEARARLLAILRAYQQVQQ